jgi:hypothetical protein
MIGELMTMLMQIEEEIKDLSQNEFSKLREWFLKYDSEVWDKQILADSQMGKLDDLAQQAIEDYKNNTFKSL